MKKQFISLSKKNPEAAKMWAFDLNDKSLSPEKIGAGSDKIVFFRCLKNPNHVFKKRISKMSSYRDGHNVGCIYCGPNAKKAFAGETDLLTIFPEAKKLWDYEKNRGIDPTSLLPKSKKKAYFRCENGHSLLRIIANFSASPSCTECKKEKYKLISRTPNICHFFIPSKNLDIILSEESVSSEKKAIFQCPKCHYEWSWQFSTWLKYALCPCCGFDGENKSEKKNQKIVQKFNIKTLKQIVKNIEDFWDYEKNQGLTPSSVSHGSNKSVWLKCDKGHSFSRKVYSISDNSRKIVVCPYCTNSFSKITPGVNDLFTVCKPAKEMWDHERNQEIKDPTKLSYSSREKAWFNCKNNHSFRKSIITFFKTPECPTCKFEKKSSIQSLKPDLIKFWDYEKMNYLPNEVSVHSKERGFWRCSDCGYEWTQSFCNRREAKKSFCPNCYSDGSCSNNFRSSNPAASNFWLDDKNQGITPDNVTRKSGKKVFLRCPNDESHIFEKTIYSIPEQSPFGCPFCSKVKTVVGQTDFFSCCSKGKRMWDWEKNFDLDPYSLFRNSTNLAWFKCENGHSFSKKIVNFSRCPKCPICITENQKVVSDYPLLLKQWNFTKNAEININSTSPNSKKLVWWFCKKCEYEWQSEIKSRKLSKGECPCCETRIKVVAGKTNLFSIVPELEKYYDYSKNKDLLIEDLSISMNDRIEWKCPECDYEWKSNPSSRYVKICEKYEVKKCPKCVRINRNEFYIKEYPDLISRFLYEKNEISVFTADKIQLNKEYWWKCVNGCKREFRSTIPSMVRSQNSVYKGCPYCSGKTVSIDNNFAVLHPDLMDEFSPDNLMDPYNIAEFSSKKAKWICRNNSEHVWFAPFQRRAIGEGNCNLCRNYHYGKMFYKEHPELKKYFDTDKNERDFSSYTNKSNDIVWWKRDEGHSFKRQLYNFKDDETFKCPICENSIVVSGINSLCDTKPELSKEWSKNNTRPAEEYSDTSVYSVLWECPDCKGEYSQVIRNRDFGDDSCPYCSNKKGLLGLNTIVDMKPKLISEWSTNNEQSIEKYSYKSLFAALWICSDCKGEFSAPIKDRDFGDKKCPYCSNRIPLEGFNTIQAVKPELVNEYSDSNERDISEFTFQSVYWVLWTCQRCENDYPASIKKREYNDNSCPYCNNRKPLKGLNTVADLKPGLLSEWSINNEGTATDYLYNSSYFVLWECSECHGEYSHSIRDQECGDDSCPYCNNRKLLKGLNTVADLKPELLSEWSINNEGAATDYLYSSTQAALWVCSKCSGEYSHSIRDRECDDDSCPYCANRKALIGFNTFEVVYPELLPFWDYINNYLLTDPSIILPKYDENVWWICEHNKDHKYLMSPKRRINFQKRKKEPCTFCKGLRRKKRHFI